VTVAPVSALTSASALALTSASAPALTSASAPARPPTPARPFVRKVRFAVAEPHFSHEATAAATLRALAHEALPASLMAWAVLAGHEPAAMVAAALILALLSFAYAPLARTRPWVREHLADLWAMLLLMAVMALSRGESTFPAAGNVDLPRVSAHAHGMSADFGMGGAGAMSAAAIAVVVAWALARVLLARRGWRIHSLVSVAVCGTCLVWMLVA
jgi:hypothetical protein